MRELKVSSRQNRMRKRLLERDGDKCWICGKPFTGKQYPSLDHIVPKHKGGAFNMENLRLAHSKCNYKRNAEGNPYYDKFAVVTYSNGKPILAEKPTTQQSIRETL